MTSFEQGDIVLVDFVFTEGSGFKRRPAVVLSVSAYHRGRQECIVAAITSNIERLLFGDHRVVHWKQAGLLHPSVVTGIIRTIRQSAVGRRLGRLQPADRTAVLVRLGRSLGLTQGRS